MARAGLVAAVVTVLGACDGVDPLGPADESSASALETNMETDTDEPSGPTSTPASPCGTAPHKSSKIGASNLLETYTRPLACQSWTVHQATFTIPASHPYRKLWASHEFDYADMPNPMAKCLASKVEFKTERRVTVGSVSLWLPVDSGSATPQYVESTKGCVWHNFNGNTGPAAPGTVVIERISARALRYTGNYDQVSTGVRIQVHSIP